MRTTNNDRNNMRQSTFFTKLYSLFQAIHVENSGDYECVAKNSRGTSKKTVRIVVLPPPTIYYENVELDGVSSLEVTLGQTFTLECLR